MKRNLAILFFILFVSIEAKCQSVKDSITVWNAKTEKRVYTVKLSKKNILININQYSYKYPLHSKKGKLYFILEDEKMYISIKKENLHINYCLSKLRESVNEIVTLKFKRQKG